ncbi:MAG: class I tRNA ligase family protein, partial [Nitratireductor sp.]|nr:class I tRNA ligase family protein [Nitratireductor sp.]
SVGNVVDPFNLIEAYGVDPVRYFFMREVAFGQDGTYSHEAIVARINADLANDLGNLAQRSLSMIAKNCDGKVPAKGELTAEDRAILDAAYALRDETRKAMETQQINKALDAVWQVVGDANRYFAAQAPWALKKTDPVRMESVLWTTAEVIRIAGIFTQFIMPQSASKLLDLLAVAADKRNFSHATELDALASGTALPEPQGVFPRWVEKEA